MRNGVVRVLPFVAIAVCLCAASAALAAPETDPPAAANGIFGILQRDMLVLKDRLGVMLSAIPQLPEIGPFLLRRITKQYDPDHIWVLGLELAIILAGAVVGEAIARRLFHPLHRFLPTLDVRTEFGKLGALLVNAVVRFFELAAFVLVAIALFFMIYDGHQAARYAFWCVFSIIVLVRLIAIGLRVVLAPSLPELRLPELDTQTARRLYWLLVSVVTLLVGAGLVGTFLYEVGLPEPLRLATAGVLIALTTGGNIIVICAARRSLTRLIGVRTPDKAQGNNLARLLAAYWHVFATCIVLVIGIAALVDRLVTDQSQVAHMYSTFGLLLGLLLIDGLLRMAVRSYFGTQTEAAPSPEFGGPDALIDLSSRSTTSAPDEDEAANAAYGAVILRNSRIALAVVAIVLLGHLWGFDAAGFGSTGLAGRITEAVFQIIVTLLLASSAWSILKIAINRHLPHEKRDALALVSDEGAGHGLSRLETLLPLVRMFLFVAIMTITAHEHDIGDGRQYRAAVGGRWDRRHRGRLRRADAGSRHPVRHLFPVRRCVPDRRIHRCRRGQGHGRTHVDPRADAPPPTRPRLHGAVRRDPPRRELQPRLDDHEAGSAGAVRHRPRADAQDRQAGWRGIASRSRDRSDVFTAAQIARRQPR